MKIKNLIIPLFISILMIACTGDAYTQLQLASSRGEIEIIKEILDSGGDINETNKHGKTALMLAAGNGRLEATQLLLERGAIIDAQEIDGMTALIMASSDGKTDTVKFLVEKGANINITNNYGATAITNAAFFNHPGAVEELLKSKQKFNTDTSENALLITAGLGLDKIMKMLLDYGVDVNARGKNARTPLMTAVEFDHIRAVKLLIENNADTKAKDTDGESIMVIAQDKGNNEIIALLDGKTGVVTK